MLPRAAQVLIILFALAVLALLAFTPDRELWLFLCGVMLVGALLAGWVIYRLLLSGKK